jgi:2-oxo-4-hydroxy-4-carboxy-5-ureidoimidazoline decarboxylase
MAAIEELDRMSSDAFRAAMAPLFEGAPAFLARLAAARPHGSWEALFDRARELAHAMPEPDQLELIDAHPRLGAPPGSVSALSFVEQGYDREGAGADAEAERARVGAELERLNDAYEAAMGFRYCVFVAGRPRAALLPAFRDALVADRQSELHRALDAVVDIARDRHRSGTTADPIAAGNR